LGIKEKRYQRPTLRNPTFPFQKGAFIIGIIGLITSALISGWCLYFHSFIILAVGLTSFVCYLGIIIGNHIEVAGLYLPFLLLMVRP
jgi:hypothetical protein